MSIENLRTGIVHDEVLLIIAWVQQAQNCIESFSTDETFPLLEVIPSAVSCWLRLSTLPLREHYGGDIIRAVSIWSCRQHAATASLRLHGEGIYTWVTLNSRSDFSLHESDLRRISGTPPLVVFEKDRALLSRQRGRVRVDERVIYHHLEGLGLARGDLHRFVGEYDLNHSNPLASLGRNSTPEQLDRASSKASRIFLMK